MNKQQVQKLVNLFRFTPWIKVIAITGGPCAGKSTFLKMAIRLLEKSGIIVFVVPEVARELISSGIVPWSREWRNATSFQKHVFFNILEKEASFFRVLEDMDLQGRHVVFLCDRGIPDGAAYTGDTDFDQMLEEYGTTRHDVIERYDGVVHLVTAAIGAEEFYVTDEERHESAEEAAQIDTRIQRVWLSHRHFQLVDNSGSFDDKVVRALLALKRMVPMPEAQEIERKFLLSFDKSGLQLHLLPPDVPSVIINQDYLDRPDRPGIECRVRKITANGVASYVYTEKTRTKQEGVRGESEIPIEEARYNELLATYGRPDWNQVNKTRYKIPVEGTEHIVELDIFENPFASLVFAEVEFKSVEDMRAFALPIMFGVYRDVTDDKRYSNASLAKHGLPKIV